MSTAELNEFPSDAFRALLAIGPKQRELIKRFMECSDEVQSVVRSMFAVLEYEHSTVEDKQRALSTIADALIQNPEVGHGSYGMELTRIQRDTAKGHPVESRRPIGSNPLDQLHAQESSFCRPFEQIVDGKKHYPRGVGRSYWLYTVGYFKDVNAKCSSAANDHFQTVRSTEGRTY